MPLSRSPTIAHGYIGNRGWATDSKRCGRRGTAAFDSGVLRPCWFNRAQRNPDPEDYADVVLTYQETGRPYQETGRRIVEQHGGVVAQFAGDGLVIQFGYPTARENGAERAVSSPLSTLRPSRI